MIALLWSLTLAHAQTPESAAPPVSAAPVVGAAEAQAMQGVIDEQIGAFRRDDAEGAWRLVDPGLQAKFGTADRFLEMVRGGYRPVYRPRSYAFREIVRIYGGYGQWMDVVGPDGESVRALYLMERQPDGTWRTSGCLLFAPEPIEPAV